MVYAIRRSGWNSWRDKSANRRIFAAAVTVGGLTIGVKLVSTVKEMVIAHQFGVNDGLDAFFIAYLLPAFAINVVAGSFNAALIPTYIKVHEHEGQAAAQRLFSSVMVWSVALLVAVSILLGLAASHILPILGSGFSIEKLALTRSLFFILLPILTLTGVTTIWGALLNARERFARMAITPILTPVAVVVVVYGLGDRWGVFAIAIAMVIGAVTECMLLAGGLRRAGVSLIPRWHGMNPAIRQVVKQYMPMVAGASLMSSTLLIDQSMAAMLGPGSVSILNYGNKVTAVILGIGSTALSAAVLPQFSRMVATDDWRGVRHTLKTYARLILLTTIPLTLLLILFSRTLVSLLFERGAFTVEDTLAVVPVLSLYILQTPFYILGMLVVRLISALGGNHILMWGTAISFILNITMNFLLIRWLGVSGIALSSTVVYVISLCFLSLMLRRLLRMVESEGSLKNSLFSSTY